MLNSANKKIDIAIIIPQEVEYRAVKKVFSLPEDIKPDNLLHGGAYVAVNMETTKPKGIVRVAIACLNKMYNYPCLAITERFLLIHNPCLLFLLGSACGRPSKVSICDVIIANDFIVHLGRGRKINEKICPRPYLVHVSKEMSTAINNYITYEGSHFKTWKNDCYNFIERECLIEDRPPQFSRNSTFEIKTGIIASDDLVLEWSGKKKAINFFREQREDAKAYDMESAGFSYACHDREQTGKPHWAVVRGISDLGLSKQQKGKYHFAATALAAMWLKGFILGGLGSLHPQHTTPSHLTGPVTLKNYDWKRLYLFVLDEMGKNKFVGKGRFIKNILKSNSIDIQALTYAIAQGAIKEFEVLNPKGRRRKKFTTAIILDKKSKLWQNIIEN